MGLSVKFSVRQDTHTHTHTHIHTHTHTHTHTHGTVWSSWHRLRVLRYSCAVRWSCAVDFRLQTWWFMWLWLSDLHERLMLKQWAVFILRCLWTSLHLSLLSAYSRNSRGNGIAMFVRPSDLLFRSWKVDRFLWNSVARRPYFLDSPRPPTISNNIMADARISEVGHTSSI